MSDDAKSIPQPQTGLDVPVESVAIARIIEEIRLEREGVAVPRSYNRVYTRHNRS